MLNLKVILVSTRPERKGVHIAEWLMEILKNDIRFNSELVDLAKVNLPLFDEPHHPRLKKYEKEHTREWSKLIEASDAFIIVTSEYNFGFPATIKNALDYLFLEWKYKALGIVSYGGISAGTRATQMLKQVVTALGMMPIPESVNIPFFTRFLDEKNHFAPDESVIKSAEGMLNELSKWGEALKTIR